MKVLRIEGENMASLFGPFCVDFTQAPLANTGVFAICGPTGSGKSTLLDAMCLALFGRTPRLTGMRKDVLMVGEFSATEDRSMLSRGTNHGFAAVTFESAQGIFRAEWKVEKYQRKAKGTTKEPSKQLFQIASNGDETVIDMRRRDIKEFTGLDYEQFTKTVLLAQGEFRKFLDATGKERSDLLEKLTNTSIYSKLGKAAFDRAKKAREDLALLQKQTEGVTCFDDGVLAQKRQEYTQVSAKLIQLRKQQEEASEAQRWHELSQSWHKQALDFQTKLDLLCQESEALRPQMQNLADWEQIEPLRTQNEARIRAKAEADAIQLQLPALQQQLQQADTLLSALHQQESQILASKDAFAIERQTWEQELAQVEPLDRELLHFKQSIAEQSQSLSQIQSALQVQLRLAHDSRKCLRSILATQQQIQHSLTQIPSDIHNQVDSLRMQREQLKAAMESLQVYLKHRTALLPTSVQQSSDASLSTLRQALVRGTPCPVCGGLEHPATLHAPEQELLQLQESLHHTESLFSVAQSQLDQRDKGHNTLAQTELKISHQQESLHTLCMHISSILQQRRQLRILLRKVTQELNLSQQKRNALLQGQSAQDVRNKLVAKSQQIQNAEQSFLTQKQTAIANRATLATRVDESQKRLDSLQQQATTIHSQIQTMRETLGLSIERGRELLSLKHEWTSETRQKLQKHQEQLAQCTGALAQVKSQLAQHQLKAPTLSSEACLQALATLLTTIPEVDAQERQLLRLLEDDKKYRSQLSELQNQIQAQNRSEQRWKRMDELIGGAEGDRFRRFAQAITLKHLTSQANTHLSHLHSRYQLQAWPNMELVIADLDMGGEVRSTRSLSGGEGFLVSMALALGLSDMASKQTQIGSLFIDEGFGTLDSDTLQSVVSVLEELRLQGRMVGIISHVDGLSKQLGASIQVKPLGNGRSSIQVM